MTELLTAEQMGAIEKAAMTAGDVTGLELMERAGRGVIDALMEKWPEFADQPGRALVYCGPGNNGGDGFVVARMLAEKGWQVDVYLFGDPEKLPPDARENHQRWTKIGETSQWDADAILTGPRPDLIIDALFGVGLTRPLPLQIAKVLGHTGKQGWKKLHAIRKVAVDCPSGLNADTGAFLAAEEKRDGVLHHRMNVADLTVTFHTPKPGHYLSSGPDLCRELVVVDIRLRGPSMEQQIIGVPPGPERVRLTEPLHFGAAGLRPVPASVWPLSGLPKMRGAGHKYDYGNVLVFAGGVGRGGAGRMAARAALRVGAGLVTVICPPAALQENASRLDAVMLRALKADAPLEDVADDRVTGFCLGPGMGVGTRTASLVKAALKRRAQADSQRDPVVVLDADALTSFSDTPQELFELTHSRTILTPHEGEFARLFPDLAQSARGGMSKIDATREAARRAGCVVLLKGPDTVIADPEGNACLHAAAYDRAAPWLATAGAGDVLAGLIVGIASAPVAPDLLVCAELAAWLHVEAALTFGPGLIAEDLPETLPRVFQALQT